MQWGCMGWEVIEKNWEQFKGPLKEQWAGLTDNHLETIAGKRDQLRAKVQELYGITEDEAEKQISSFEEGRKKRALRDSYTD